VPELDRAVTKQMDKEDRRQQRLRRLGTQDPICVACGESDPAVLELHHIAGRKYDDDESIVCANCHRKLSDKQRDHSPSVQTQSDGQSALMGHYLLGGADLLALIVDTLRKFGTRLIAESRRGD
jgi:hypothetical protein